MPPERVEDPGAAHLTAPAFDAELLAEHVGRSLTRDPAHRLWRDERFLDWLTVEARERYERTHRMSDADFRRRGEEVMARVYAQRFGITRISGIPRTDGQMGDRDCGRVQPVAQSPVPIVEIGIAAGDGRELWDEPVTSWLELPAHTPPGKYLALHVVGESMAPLMHTGDVVLVRVEDRVRRDTVIVARQPNDGYVCKRVGRLQRRTIELLSLAPGRPPIAIPRDPTCVLGTVIRVWSRDDH